ncbi:hypothetical protein AAES_147538 [Amazona aestiva]|uniref:SET domain-containing protein n=1 Tax=Amazona aestiva TaxID=12930 RepID=A0A0Q3LY08_AMAAE|nr:hypothetical protein AAES_147538 [Amazona aestiva]
MALCGTVVFGGVDVGLSKKVNCSHKLEYIKLKKWLKDRGFEDSNLRPAEFLGTGRGLMTTKALQVKAAFNEQTRSYEIRTNSQCKRYEEVFICYGPHDNQRLLLEYGFVAVDNPHSSVYVSSDFPVEKEQREPENTPGFGRSLALGKPEDTTKIS